MSDFGVTTVKSLYEGLFGGTSSVLKLSVCKEIVLFGRFKMYWNYREKILGP